MNLIARKASISFPFNVSNCINYTIREKVVGGEMVVRERIRIVGCFVVAKDSKEREWALETNGN